MCRGGCKRSWVKCDGDRITPRYWSIRMSGIGVPQTLADRHRPRHRIERDDLEREPGLVDRRHGTFHRRIDADRVQPRRVARTVPLVNLMPVRVAVKIRRDIGMPGEKLLELVLLHRAWRVDRGAIRKSIGQ